MYTACTISACKKRLYGLQLWYNYSIKQTAMPQNSIIPKFDTISTFMFNNRFIIALLCAALLLAAGCKKTVEDISDNTLQKYFEDNILNKPFVVNYALDDSTDRTAEFDGYTFILTKTTSYFDGPMTGTKGDTVITGTWASNEDYGKLVINLTNPTPPASFSYLNRAWRFTRKSLPVMELAPWGTTDPKVLHMRRL